MSRRASQDSKVIDLQEQVAKRIADEQGEQPDVEERSKPLPKGRGPDDPTFVAECLEHNERGDGILYAALHRGKHVYNKTTGRWLSWNGHHWEDDILDQAHNSVEGVALRYQLAADNIAPELKGARERLAAAKETVKDLEKRTKDLVKDGTAEELAEHDSRLIEARAAVAQAEREVKALAYFHKNYSARVDRMRSKVGVEKTLYFSHTVTNGLRIRSEDLDRHPLLLPCSNGVIDLETGKLVTGKPDDYLMRAIKVDFLGVEKINREFDRFVIDIYQGDEELAAFVQRLLGYCCTGLRTEHFIACFVGAGRNGKGTLFEIMHDVLGDLSWAIDPEMLLDQKNARNSASHSADLVSLRGRRLAIAAETDRGKQISCSAVKRLTGGDMIKARAPMDRDETNFRPTHKLVLHTNELPSGLAKDFALVQRLLKIDHPLRYVDDPVGEARKNPHLGDIFRPKDRHLPDRLRSDLPGILSWLVQGCLEWAVHGLNPPDSIRASVEEVRRSEDHLGTFLSDVVVSRAENRLLFKTFYQRFSEWYADTIGGQEKYRPTKRTVTKELRERGYCLPDPRETGGNLVIMDIDVQIAGIL